ncbi:MAG: PSD1 and planctomycete cytochrome C domain-containing protein [Planctomycetota bacterium]
MHVSAMKPLFGLGILALFAGLAMAEEAEFTPEQLAFFEKRVRPVLVEHCYACHGAEATRIEAGLLVDSRHELLTGGDSGPAVAPGDADASLLIEAVRYESYEMPPKGKLPAQDIEALERWVAMGAPWPEEAAKDQAGRPAREVFDLAKRKSEHWAWQPVRSPQPPTVDATEWPRTAADQFILRRLEEAGLEPTEDVDRTGLLRRAYFDLIGLPPTRPQVEAFLKDQRPDAFERVVDELLASPHFGERWGRHWLDLVRYAESRGHEFDGDARNAHQYRDYVIRALNADVPYDQFVREHIAGDLIETPRLHPQRGFNESILGTGFWFLGEWVHSPVDIRKDESDRFDNMIDVMSKAFLGVTVSCARCHDHKFDAISSADYYALTGFLQSSDYRQVRFESLEANGAVAAELAAVDRRQRQRVRDFFAQHGMPSGGFGDRLPELKASVVVDYGTLPGGQFFQDGYAFGRGPRQVGEPYLADSEGTPAVRLAARGSAVTDAAWRTLKSVTEGAVAAHSELEKIPRSGRTLRTPTFELTDGVVHCRVRGEGRLVVCVDSHRMIAGPLHKRTLQKVKPGAEWTRLDLSDYVGNRLHLEFIPSPGKSLDVAMVLQGATDSDLAIVQTFERETAEAVRAFQRSVDELLATDAAARAAYESIAAEWAEERGAVEQRIQRGSRLAMAMMDGTGEDGRLLIRGDSSKPADVVPRRFLEAIAGPDPMPIHQGSGRLELADRIVDPTNPLTSRVIVNRLWRQLMGRGIVPSTDDFGVLGQTPTHPELLDFLATRFVAEGQSLKGMLRYLMHSRTYRMSTKASVAAREQDPKNLLWSHRPPKRLEGEAIRDSLLAIAGRLDTRLFGPPTPIHLTSFMTGRGRPDKSGPLDGDGRRSIYIAVRRNFLSPFMLAFDTPSPFSTMGNRNVSNVPAQSLILMNHPLVAELSKRWAERVLDASPGEGAEPARIEAMYYAAFGRPPTTAEADAAAGFVREESSERGVPADDAGVWSDLAHALVNAKEFVFLR